MKVFFNKIFKNYFVLTLTIFLAELIFRYVSKLSFADWAVLRIFIGVSIISLLFSFIFSILPRKINNILCFIFGLVTSIYITAQAGFNNFMGVYVSLGASNQLGAVKEYFSDYIHSFDIKFFLILIPAVLSIIFYFFVDKRIKFMENNEELDFSDKFSSEEQKEINKKKLIKDRKTSAFGNRMTALISLALLCGAYYGTLTLKFMQNELQLESNLNLFKNPTIQSIAINQFGASTYFVLDFKQFLLPSKSEIQILEPSSKGVEEHKTDYARKIDDTTWNKVIEDEKNKDFQTLNNYFINKRITPKNDYTGIFEDKNLIVIMLESGSPYIYNQEYFPNFNRLVSNGWTFTNSYSPRSESPTINSETSGMMSLYGINTMITANVYKNNVYPESLFNLFLNKDYDASSYHDYTEKYYYRKTIHKNMGSTYYGVDSLDINYSSVYGQWPSDVLLMEKVLEHLSSQDKFMTWITTVSGHSPYRTSSILGDKYLDLFNDKDYSKDMKRYLSKMKEDDEAIGVLLDGLEEQGKLDDTVIVVYCDHYPYALKADEYQKDLEYDVNLNNEIDRTPFIIYNPQITKAEYDQYTSYMNLTPTLANLFNLDYDPRHYEGFDIFDDKYEDRVIFNDGSWQDKKAFYDVTSGNLTYTNENDQYSIEEIKEINNQISLRIKMSNLAIKTNYFYRLFEKIKDIEIEEAKEVVIKNEETDVEVDTETKTTE